MVDSSRLEPGEESDALARDVIGAAIAVHRALGPGFVESVYENALCIELAHRAVAFNRQVVVPLQYRDEKVGETRIDIVVGGRLVVELKAIEAIAPIHTAQVVSYLKAIRRPLGLLLNFNVQRLRDGIKRVVFSP
jgi:GxxExxY protein